jgi:uncharacterized membrane protein
VSTETSYQTEKPTTNWRIAMKFVTLYFTLVTVSTICIMLGTCTDFLTALATAAVSAAVKTIAVKLHDIIWGIKKPQNWSSVELEELAK